MSDFLTMPDGTPLFVNVGRRAASAPDRGTIVLVHGLGEHSGRYTHVVELLREMGWTVVRYDQRGHGRSGGKRGALPRADALLEDLGEVIRFATAEGKPRRLLLLGHSMGGTIVARFAAEGLQERPAPWFRPVDAIVLSSPALLLAGRLTVWDRLRLVLLSRIAPRLAVPNKLPSKWLSHDAGIVEAYDADPLVHHWVTARLAKFIVDSGAAALAAASRWRVKTLLIWAGADRLVAASGSAAFAAAAPKDVVQAREFPALYHEIFNEAEPARSEVLAVLHDWLAGVAA